MTLASTSTVEPHGARAPEPPTPPAAELVPAPAREVHPPPRIASLDALRGFTMFWILGGAAFGRAFHDFPQSWPISKLAEQFEHAEWVGFHFEDLIFPMFVFVSGVSLVLALPRKVEKDGRAKAAWQAGRRALVLYALGVWCYGGVAHGWEGVRWVGVLQRIAFAYFCSALLFLWLKPRTIAIVAAVLLLGYWALLALAPVPGFGRGDFAETHNLTNYLDRLYLPGRKWDGDHDPEGLLSSLPAVATCLFGVFAGIWLTRPESHWRKVGGLILAGAALIGIGWGWGFVFPIIKKLWTSSYVLEAAGWSAILLGVFYLVIDVVKIRRWAIPFVWIGLNPITLYLLENLVSSTSLAQRVVGGEIYRGLDVHLFPGAGALLLAAVASSISFGVAWFLHHRRVYLRV